MIPEPGKMKTLKTTVVFLVWCGLVLFAEAVCSPGQQCPSKCNCTSLPSSYKMLVNCGNKDLDQLPILPSNTEMLVIRNSNLTSLPDNAFEGCSSLLYLDLSSNLLKRVDEKAFAGLEQLESLLLNNNSVDISTLSTSLLQNLTHLSRLFIHDNDVLDNVTTYNDQLFAPLIGLQMLIMDGLPNATFGPGFSSLHHLEYFKVVGKLQYITNDTFKHFNNSALKTFVVRSGVLTDVDEMAFGHFNHLETLDLSFNPLLGFPNVSKAWYGMQFTNISSIYLKRSVPYDHQIITIDNEFLKHLERTKLKRLVLDANNIVTINALFSIHTPHLEHLSVAHSRLVQVSWFILDVSQLENLEIFDVSFQSRLYIQQADHDITEENIMDTLPLLGIEHNKLTTKTSQRFQHKRELPRTSTRFTSPHHVANIQPIPSGPIDLWISQNLRVFNGAGSLTIGRDTLHKITVHKGGSNLENLNYSMNNLREFWGPLIIKSPPQNKFVVDLSSNNCNFLHPGFMEQPGPYLGALYLGRNNLGQQLAVDNNGTIFQYFKELIKLDLSSNNINSLPGKVFIKQSKMEHLNLRDNSLRLINFNITHMDDLKFVDLSSNLLDQLDDSTRSRMELLARRNNFTVDLTDNPLHCSCETLRFLEWLPQTNVQLKDWEKYICVYNGQLTELVQLKKVILPKLAIDCQSKAWLIASAIVLVALFILTGVVYAMHRYRFEIKYCCLRFVIQRRKYHDLIGKRKEYEYDAFVSFDQQDIPWVNEELIPALDAREGHGDFNLLLHHRDFQPGTKILENICNGIETSRHIILIVSRHFVKSRWCKEELEMARIHCFEEGKELPLVILLEEKLPLLKSSATLRALLRRNTYLKWPEDENERPNFWANLKNALASKPERRYQITTV